MNDGRIVTWAEYGVHIALTCANHTELTWSTKNIAPLGSRSIFWMPPRPYDGTEECRCPVSDLMPVAG